MNLKYCFAVIVIVTGSGTVIAIVVVGVVKEWG
jgi:hypothetical protein